MDPLILGIITLGNYIINSQSLSSVSNTFLPIILIAILADSMIISLWYMIASIINSSEWKAGAISELYQLVGTLIILAIVLWALSIYGSLFASYLSNTPMGPTSTTLTCVNLELHSKLSLLSTTTTSTYSALAGAGGVPFGGLCSYIYAQNIAPSLQSNLDYPLAAVGIITANLTNQTAMNLNSFFITDSYTGYLKGLTPKYEFCLDNYALGNLGDASCLIPPLSFTDPQLMNIIGSYKPYAGFGLVYNVMRTLGTLLMSAVESLIGQLLIVSIMIYIWPYLLFIGLLARVFPYTRKIGGLFIAITIGILFFYPFIFSMEYMTLGTGLNNLVNQNSISGDILGLSNIIQSSNPISSALNTPLTPGAVGSAYGTNYSTTNTLTMIPAGLNGVSPYNLNFFSQPSIESIAKYNNCWPTKGSTFGSILSEIGNTAYFLFPPTSGYTAVLTFLRTTSSIPSGVPTLYIPNSCNEQSSETMVFMIINAYGVIGVSAYWLPILNVVITLSGIVGLSALFGGDTSLAGLSNLV